MENSNCFRFIYNFRRTGFVGMGRSISFFWNDCSIKFYNSLMGCYYFIHDIQATFNKKYGFWIDCQIFRPYYFINPFTVNNQLSLVGIISLTLSSIFWAFGSLYSTKYKDSENIFASGGLLMIVGVIMLIVTSFVVGEFYNLQLSKISLNTIFAYLYLIFLCTSVGYAEFFWLLKVEPVSMANSFAYIVPIIAVFLGWAVFNENISIETIIATTIIMIGVALMIKSSSNSSSNLSINKVIKTTST